MKKGQTQVIIMLVFFGSLFLIPPRGDGADLTISNIITGNGNMTLNGWMNATSFYGDGANLSNVTAARWKVAYVAVVAQGGGDYTDPVTAMANLSAWCPSPLPSTPCLLKIMPGTYDLGTNHVTMQSYVDIEGSGMYTTILKGHGPSVVIGASAAELRFLEVYNAGQADVTIASAIYNNTASPRITEVGAFSWGSTSANNYAIWNEHFSDPELFRVTADARYASAVNRGIYSTGKSTPLLTQVTANAWYGNYADAIRSEDSNPYLYNVTAYAYGGAITSYGVSSSGVGSLPTVIQKSQIGGDTGAIFNDSGVTTRVAITRVDGLVTNSGGTLTCVGAYSQNFTPLNGNCQ